MFVFGLLFGALAGAATAMWNAVRSGEETRRLITEGGLELRDRAQEVALETRDQIAQAGTELRDRAEAAISETRGQIAQTGTEIRDRAEAAVTGAKAQLARQADQIRTRVTGERLEDSVAEGKAIARQRRADLSQNG